MEREYSIGMYLLNGVFSNPDMMVNRVMQEFNLSRSEAIAILESRTFNKLLDRLIAIRNMANEMMMLNKLGEIIDQGNHSEKIYAIDTLIYLAQNSFGRQRVNRI